MNRALTSALLFLVLTLPLTLHAQTWTPFGPPGAPIDILIEDEETGAIYLYGYNHGILLQSPGESVWEPMSSPGTIAPGDLVQITQLFGWQGHLLAVRGNNAFFFSPNGGGVWDTIPVEAPGGIGPIVALRDTLYATASSTTYVAHLIYSVDGGVTWTPGDTLGRFATLASDGQTLMAYSMEGLVRWNGEGEWETLPIDAPPLNNVMIDGETVVAVDARTGVHYSLDGGATWETAPVGGGYGIPFGNDTVWIFYSLALHHDTLWSVRPDGIYTMPVGGTAWTLEAPIDRYHWSMKLVVIDEDLLLVQRSGLQRWDDATNRFVPFDDGLDGVSRLSIGQIVEVDDTLLVTTTLGLYTTGDEGATWQHRTEPYSTEITRLTLDGRFIYTIVGDSILRSEDLGRSWNAYKAGDGEDSVRPDAIHVRGGIIIAGGRRGIIRTTNGGADWERLPIPTLQRVTAIVGSGDTLFASYGNSSDPLIRSTDFGDTWETVTTLERGPVITTLAYENGVLYLGTANNGLERSFDGGESWSRTLHFDLDDQTPDTTFVAITDLDVYGDSLFVHVSYGMEIDSTVLYASPNRGSYWQRLTRPDGNSHTIYPLGARLLAGTYAASVQATQVALGVDDRHTISAEMSIGYDAIRGIVMWRCDMAATYRIDLYTLTGKHVMLLADGEAAGGSHLLPIDDLPAGAYLCVLHSGGESAAVVVTAR